ncbi:MAG TPA: DUF4349 domain-containing protein [Terriglobales bacterium]|nr:DUF4349 domain-containing protein [Terriglobales bacterium]
MSEALRLSMVSRKKIGSWLVTASLVLGVLLTIIAVATPNLLRSRISANESSAVGSVRTLNTALATYKAEHPQAGYPPQLAELAPYVDANLTAGQKAGYNFTYTPVDQDGDGVSEAFDVKAQPIEPGKSGQRHFSSDETGSISYQQIPAGPKELLGGGTPSSERRPAGQIRRMIQNGSMNLIVSEPSQSTEVIRTIAYRLGGYVESEQTSGYAGERTVSITIRVPGARYEEARRAIRGLGQRVENERDEARDVTGQYVDLESSLRNFRAEEAQYLEIMRRAGSIKDTLAVAERLADVRGRIERTQGQLNLLARQTEMASLAVTLRTEPVVQPTTVRWHPAAEVKAAFWDAADNLATYANFMIAVLFRLPVMLLWIVTLGVGLAAGWKMLRWMWKRLFATAPAAAA